MNKILILKFIGNDTCICLFFEGADEGMWYMDLKSGSGKIGQGEPPNGADCTMTLDSEDFVKMFKGELKAVSAFMSGKLKIQGDMGLAMKLEKLMNKMDISKL